MSKILVYAGTLSSSSKLISFIYTSTLVKIQFRTDSNAVNIL